MQAKIVKMAGLINLLRRSWRHLILQLVRPKGLEPSRLSALPPQGSASTNSATAAHRCKSEASLTVPFAVRKPSHCFYRKSST
jgi:hypothetical protein